RSHHGQQRKHRTPHRTPHGTPHRTSPPSHIATFEWRLSHDEPTSASRDCQRRNLGSPTKKLQPRSPPKSELTGSASVVCINQVEKPFKTGRGRRPSGKTPGSSCATQPPIAVAGQRSVCRHVPV